MVARHWDKINAGLIPDVILLDVMMPVMDGWHFISARLAHPQLVEVPIIIISAGMEAQREAHKVGVFNVARKPLHIDSLIKQIESAHRATGEARQVSAEVFSPYLRKAAWSRGRR